MTRKFDFEANGSTETISTNADSFSYTYEEKLETYILPPNYVFAESLHSFNDHTISSSSDPEGSSFYESKGSSSEMERGDCPTDHAFCGRPDEPYELFFENESEGDGSAEGEANGGVAKPGVITVFSLIASAGRSLVNIAAGSAVAADGAARSNTGLWGDDTDGDGYSNHWLGGTLQWLGVGTPYGEAALPDNQVLSVGDFERHNGGNAHEALNAAKNEVSSLLADAISEAAIELATAGIGGVFAKIDNVDDFRKAAKAKNSGFAKPIIARLGELRDFNAKNFRHNLKTLWGIDPKGYDAHHVFPQALENLFKKRIPGLEIHNPVFGAWWEQSAHRSAKIPYQKAWEQFLSKDRTVDEAIEYGKKLANQFDFDWSF